MGLLSTHTITSARRFRPNPNLVVVLGFLSVIAAGTLLLMTSPARTPENPGRLADAIFTATSATCVTGLSVLDIAANYTLFGQLVILALVEIGGLGIMLFGTLLMMFIGRQLSLNDEASVAAMYGLEGIHKVRTLVWRAALMTLLFQGAGAVILAWRYIRCGYELPQAIYFGIYHSIMAFCNAGMSLHPDSLVSFAHDPCYGLTMAALIIAGGIGFLVMRNLTTIRFWKRDLRARGKVSLHTRMVLVTTLALLLIPLACYLVLEWNHAFTGASITQKIYLAFFHAATARTAGFNMVPMESFSPASNMLAVISMTIGASPGSMAGGMKGTTLFVVLLTLAATLKGRVDTEWNGRTIPLLIVRNAFIVFFLYLALILTTFCILLAVDPLAYTPDGALKLLFETASAFGTVGLSLDTTPHLSPIGRAIIIVSMFIGRLGPLSVIMLLGTRASSQHVRYPEEEVAVG